MQKTKKKKFEIFDKKHKFKKKIKIGLNKRDIVKILIFLIIVNNLVAIAAIYPRISGNVVLEEVEILRIIDGDTFETNMGKIRLIGINCPEQNQLYFSEAKNYTLILEGEIVEIENLGEDKYGRTLAYVYYKGDLINEELLKNGLAHLYYYEKDSHFKKMERAEKKARDKEVGIWKKSDNYGCIDLIELKYEEDERCSDDEILVLYNKCGEIKAVLKDDATHIYDVKIGNVFSKDFSCIWNNDGDSVYIWDDDGLVFFYRY